LETLSSNNEPIEGSPTQSGHLDNEYDDPNGAYQLSTFSTSNSFRDRLRKSKRPNLDDVAPTLPRPKRLKKSQNLDSLAIKPSSVIGGGASDQVSATEPRDTGNVADGTGHVADDSSPQMNSPTSDLVHSRTTSVPLVQYSATKLTEVTSTWAVGGVQHLTTICGTAESRELICALRSQILTPDGCPNAELMSSCAWEPLFGLMIGTERDSLIKNNQSARAFINLKEISSRLPTASQTLSGNDNNCDLFRALT
jgi:hypothetical protein